MRFAGVRPEKEAELEQRLAQLGVRESELEERFIRARGPGGQKVNKTSTAVCLKHVPSNVEVRVDTERSQGLNRFFARRLLADRLEELQGKPSARQTAIVRVQRQKQRRRRRARAKVRGGDE